MNLFSRIKAFLQIPSSSRTLGLIALLILLISIPITINFLGQRTQTQQHAYITCTNDGSNYNNDGCGQQGGCSNNYQAYQWVSYSYDPRQHCAITECTLQGDPAGTVGHCGVTPAPPVNNCTGKFFCAPSDQCIAANDAQSAPNASCQCTNPNVPCMNLAPTPTPIPCSQGYQYQGETYKCTNYYQNRETCGTSFFGGANDCSNGTSNPNDLHYGSLCCPVSKIINVSKINSCNNNSMAIINPIPCGPSSNATDGICVWTATSTDANKFQLFGLQGQVSASFTPSTDRNRLCAGNCVPIDQDNATPENGKRFYEDTCAVISSGTWHTVVNSNRSACDNAPGVPSFFGHNTSPSVCCAPGAPNDEGALCPQRFVVGTNLRTLSGVSNRCSRDAIHNALPYCNDPEGYNPNVQTVTNPDGYKTFFCNYMGHASPANPSYCGVHPNSNSSTTPSSSPSTGGGTGSNPGGGPGGGPSCTNGQQTAFGLNIKLEGIGPGQFENPSPAHPNRNAAIEVKDDSGNSIFGSSHDFSHRITHNNGKFAAGNIDLGTSKAVCDKKYTLSVKVPGYLPATAGVVYGNTSQVLEVEPLPRDINAVDVNTGIIIGDNKIDVNDYNIYKSCHDDTTDGKGQDPDKMIHFLNSSVVNGPTVNLKCRDLINFFDYSDGGTQDSPNAATGVDEFAANYNLWLRSYLKANGL